MAVNKLTLETDGLVVGATQLVTSGGGVSVGQNLVVQGNTYVQQSEVVGGNLTVGGNITSPVGSALTLQTNGGTAAVSIDTNQNTTFNANVSFANAVAVGFTLLGTITLSGTGNQFQLGGLNLSSYKALYVVFNAVSAGAISTKLSFTNTTGDQTGPAGNFTVSTSTNTSIGLTFGGCYIDSVSGLATATTSINTYPTGTSAPVPVGTTQVAGAGGSGGTGSITGIGTATTTIYVYVTGAGTKSGTIAIYGIK